MSEDTTATAMSMRMDLRRNRAMPLTAAIFDKMRPFIEPDRLRDAHEELYSLLLQEGIEILTDQTRAEAGLPPRGPDGWTAAELHALEASRLQLLLPPSVGFPLIDLKDAT